MSRLEYLWKYQWIDGVGGGTYKSGTTTFSLGITLISGWGVMEHSEEGESTAGSLSSTGESAVTDMGWLSLAEWIISGATGAVHAIHGINKPDPSELPSVSPGRCGSVGWIIVP